ncbi:MAG TPA: 2-amino-4-hydroxy-6-hydroxymethyldihydropteridine diphosphokinase, partial [Opitutales bacterium]|nr:2-amino-4-hydroxy-6-hydroxymethyldihydropteridine diphosphokinase [Opitutales bacterium]
LELLDRCLEVEQHLGRNRSAEGWTPRTIDLDLLFYECVNLNDERLILPHPRIEERDFVAVPFADIAPELEINQRSLWQIARGLAADELRVFSEKLL